MTPDEAVLAVRAAIKNIAPYSVSLGAVRGKAFEDDPPTLATLYCDYCVVYVQFDGVWTAEHTAFCLRHEDCPDADQREDDDDDESKELPKENP